MHSNPFLFDLRSIHGILLIMPDHFEFLYMKMHHIFQGSSITLMESAVEAKQVSMLQFFECFAIKIDDFTVQSQQYVWLIVIFDPWFHLHEKTQCMLIEFMRILSVIQHSQEMSLPIHKLLSSIFLQTNTWVRLTAFLNILWPRCRHPFLTIHLCYADRHHYYNEEKQSSSHDHLLCENESSREKTQTVHFISKIEKELTVIAQLSLTEGTTVLTCGCEVHEHDYQQHHGKMRHDHEQAHSQHDGNELRFQYYLASNMLETKWALH